MDSEDSLSELSDDSSQMSFDESDGSSMDFPFLDDSSETESDESGELQNQSLNKHSIPLIWSTKMSPLSKFEFTGPSGLISPINKSEKDLLPIDVFQKFITDEVFELMASETNRSILKANKTSNDKGTVELPIQETNIAEMRYFLGIVMYISFLQGDNMKLFWSRNPMHKMNFTELFTMSHERFNTILKHWNFVEVDNSDNDQVNDDSDEDGDVGSGELFKVTPLIDMVMGNVRNCYHDESIVIFTEFILPYKWPPTYTRYIKLVEKRAGVKIVRASTPNGFICRFYPYETVDVTEANLNRFGTVIVNMSKDILNQGRTYIIDETYSSVSLAKLLYENKTHLCAAIKKKQPDLPTDVCTTKIEMNSLIARQSNYMNLYKWNNLLMLTTLPNNITTGTHKDPPDLMQDFIKWHNSNVETYQELDESAIRKEVPCYKNIAYALIFETIVKNSFILYNQLKQDGGIRKIENFRLDISYGLLTHHTQHTFKRIPEDKKTKKVIKGICGGCMDLKGNRRESLTDTECITCQRPVCWACFHKTH